MSGRWIGHSSCLHHGPCSHDCPVAVDRRHIEMVQEYAAEERERKRKRKQAGHFYSVRRAKAKPGVP